MKISIRFLNLIVLAALVLGGFSGCEKFLDRKPLGTATEDDIVQGGAEAKVLGLYAGMRTWGVSSLPYLMVHSVRSDDADKGSTATDGADSEDVYDNFNYTKDHWPMTNYWDDHYSFIGQCNDVIHDLDSLQLNDPASLVNRGEASFFRAWAYFDLVRAFGEVPKIDFKVYTAAQANVPKSTVDEIYALIDADLQVAVANLPLNWEQRYIGRLTNGAAKTLQAKTFMYRGRWSEVLAVCKDIIGTGQYALFRPYIGIWREENENSTESIFELQFYENTGGTIYYGNEYSQVQGVRGASEWDLGWGWNAPNQVLVNSYEPDDPRKDATILYSGEPDGIYGDVVPTSPPLARPYWNKKIYTNPAIRASTGDRFGWWNNVRMLRYADVILMAAEAANELGGTDNINEALTYLEMIRDRARNGNTSILPPVTTTDQVTLRGLIRMERRAEFGMEHERFFDLVRWGIAQSTFATMGKTFEPRDKYLPIPLSAIDKSGGVLIQNPDYP